MLKKIQVFGLLPQESLCLLEKSSQHFWQRLQLSECCHLEKSRGVLSKNFCNKEFFYGRNIGLFLNSEFSDISARISKISVSVPKKVFDTDQNFADEACLNN